MTPLLLLYCLLPANRFPVNGVEVMAHPDDPSSVQASSQSSTAGCDNPDVSIRVLVVRDASWDFIALVPCSDEGFRLHMATLWFKALTSSWLAAVLCMSGCWFVTPDNLMAGGWLPAMYHVETQHCRHCALGHRAELAAPASVQHRVPGILRYDRVG